MAVRAGVLRRSSPWGRAQGADGPGLRTVRPQGRGRDRVLRHAMPPSGGGGWGPSTSWPSPWEPSATWTAPAATTCARTGSSAATGTSAWGPPRWVWSSSGRWCCRPAARCRARRAAMPSRPTARSLTRPGRAQETFLVGIGQRPLHRERRQRAPAPQGLLVLARGAGGRGCRSSPSWRRCPRGGASKRSVRGEDSGAFPNATFDAWVRRDPSGRGFRPTSACCGRPADAPWSWSTTATSMPATTSCSRRIGAAGWGTRNCRPLPGWDRLRPRQPGCPRRSGRSCDVRFLCNGGWPRERLATGLAGEPGVNHLCAGYRRFFHHGAPHLRRLAALWRGGIPPSTIMVRCEDAARSLPRQRPPVQALLPARPRRRTRRPGPGGPADGADGPRHGDRGADGATDGEQHAAGRRRARAGPGVRSRRNDCRGRPKGEATAPPFWPSAVGR
jgi:hypothetical protein